MSAYPVTFESDYVEAPRNRATTFFRLIMIIPLVIVFYIYNLLAGLAVIVAWFAILFTGKFPPAIYDFVAGFIRFRGQFTGYAALMTDQYAPFWGNVEEDYPVRVRFGGPLPKYNRWKTFFRGILAFPLIIFASAVRNALVGYAAVGSWFVIVFTGGQPKGVQDALRIGVSYTTRAQAYIYLLTESYPPFLEGGEGGAAAGGPSPTLPTAAAVPQPAPESPVAGPGGPESPGA